MSQPIVPAVTLRSRQHKYKEDLLFFQPSDFHLAISTYHQTLTCDSSFCLTVSSCSSFLGSCLSFGSSTVVPRTPVVAAVATAPPIRKGRAGSIRPAQAALNAFHQQLHNFIDYYEGSEFIEKS